MKRKKKKLAAAGAALVGLTLTLSGCGVGGNSGSSNGAGGAGSSDGTIRIGMATALTGPYTIVGQYLKDGAEMAADEINANGGINGKKIQLVEEDSQNTNSAAINAFNKLLYNDHVVAIVAPDLSTQLLAVMPLVNKNKVVTTVEGTNVTLTQKSSWYFRLRPDDAIAADAAAKFAVQNLHLTKIAVTHDTDEFGTGGATIIENTLKSLGITPVDVEAYSSSDKDVSAQLHNIQAKGAQGIIDWGHPQQGAVMMKQNKELGLNLKLVGSPAYSSPSTLNLTNNDYIGDYAVIDGLAVGSPNPKTQEFVKNYQAKYNMPPDFHATATYDGVYMLAQALKNAKSMSSADIAAAMHQIANYDGTANTFDFTKSNNGAQSVTIVQMQAGQKMNKIAVIHGNGTD